MMYNKTESEISLADKMKQNCDTTDPALSHNSKSCLGKRSLLEKILFLTVMCLFICILGLILGIVFQDKSIFTSSAESANNPPRSTFYYTQNPKWINRAVYQSDDASSPKICLTKGCIEAASSVLAKLDPRVDPCEDFYQFACGGYTSQAVIPD